MRGRARMAPATARSHPSCCSTHQDYELVAAQQRPSQLLMQLCTAREPALHVALGRVPHAPWLELQLPGPLKGVASHIKGSGWAAGIR